MTFLCMTRVRLGRIPVTQTLESVDLDRELDRASLPDTPWVTIVWNDPVNLMTYVSWVFRSYFGFDRAEAERLMMLVHTEGRAVVATGGREEMERHVEAMHDFGLWATLTRSDA
jgi:ATP-dependent Clp protease adaptor protein ClpS